MFPFFPNKSMAEVEVEMKFKNPTLPVQSSALRAIDHIVFSGILIQVM